MSKVTFKEAVTRSDIGMAFAGIMPIALWAGITAGAGFDPVGVVTQPSGGEVDFRMAFWIAFLVSVVLVISAVMRVVDRRKELALIRSAGTD